MLSRLYADNFRCLVNFELSLGRIVLLLGPNGAGKSTIFDLLERLRRLVVDGARIDDCFTSADLTAWETRFEQRFELDMVRDDAHVFRYALTISHDPDRRRVRIERETLHLDGQALFEFAVDGSEARARLFRDDGSAGGEYLFDWSRSGVGALPERPDNTQLTWFRRRLGSLLVVRPNPMLIGGETRDEVTRPDPRLGNFASWYRWLSQEQPGAVMALNTALREVLPGFDVLRLRQSGEAKLLEATMQGPDGRRMAWRLGDLSDGERALIALYTLIHCLPDDGATLCIDEPENFLALPEIGPWLDRFDERCAEPPQQGILISHHPRPINLLARDAGYWIDRDGPLAPTRVRRIEPGTGAAGVSMDQLVERGWVFDE